MKRFQEFVYGRHPFLLSSIAGALTVTQIVLALFFRRPGPEFLKLAGQVCWWASAIFGWLPIFTFRRKGGVPKGKSFVYTTTLVETGIYAIVRLLGAFAPGTALGRAEWILLNLGAVSVIVGHSLALGQTNLKKMLAYSSIAHVGIIVIGAGLGTVPGLMGSLFHAMNHMFMKSTAFFAAGQLGVHRRFEVAEMHGVGWQAPFAAAVFLVSALSLIGLPPLGGFIGKWEITLDAVRQRHFFHAAAILFGTLLSAVYYGRAVRTFFSAPAQGAPGKSSEGLLTSLVLVGGATGCVVPFFLWGTMEPVLTHIADLVRH